MATAGFANAGVVFIAKGVDSFLASVKKINSTIEGFNTKISKFAASANRQAFRGFDNLAPKLKSLIDGSAITTTNFDELESQINHLASNIFPLLTKAILASAAAISVLVGVGVKTAISFENSFTEVTKTVDAFIDRAATAEAGVIQLTEEGQKFRDELKALSGEIPVTFEKLSEVAGLGGQLGIVEGLAGDEAREALVSFTETVAGLGEATNLTRDVAATGLAQITNIFRDDVEDIGLNVEQLGATIVELGNTSAAQESLILNFAKRIAGAGKTIGLTQAEVFGIGTAFASIGITAEAGSTAVNRALLIINEAVALSSETFADNTAAILGTQEALSDVQADLVRLEAQTGVTGESMIAQRDAFLEAGGAVEDWGRQLGDARREQLFQTQTEVDRLTQKLEQLRVTQGQALTTEVFDELLRVVQQTEKGAELTAEAFQDLFVSDPAEAFTLFVEGLAKDGERAGETLDRIGLGSVEATRAFLAIAGASETVRDRILAATEAFQENTALIDEVSIRYATLRSNFLEFLNVIRGVTDTLFSPLIDPLIGVVEWGKEVVLVLGESIPEVIEALANKFGPELQKIFDEIFGPTGLFGAGEITTPEGFTLSGDLIGIEPQSITAIKNSFDSLIETINSLDVSNLSNQAIAFRDTIVPIWTGAVSLVTENADIFIGAVKGIIAILGGVALFSAASKAAAAIGFLSTPLGTVSLLAVGFGIAWETNFLNIQTVTSDVVTKVQGSLAQLAGSIQSIDLQGLFDSGTRGVEPSFFDNLGLAAEGATELIGNLVNLVIQVPVDQISGLIELFRGLVTIVDNLTSSAGTAKGALDGLGQVVSGFVDAVTAPLKNLAQFFGLEFDTTVIKEFAFNAAKNFIEGFVEGITGVEVGDLGNSFTELLGNIVELGQSPGIQVFIAGLVQMSEGLIDLAEALGNLASSLGVLLGLEPDDSLFSFLGMIAGFMAKITVDQVINVVEALTGFVIVLDGLTSLDFTQVTEGLTQFGLAVASMPLDAAQRIGELFGTDVKLSVAQGILDLISFTRETWDQGIEDLGESLAVEVTLPAPSDSFKLSAAQWVLDVIAFIRETWDQTIAGLSGFLAIEIPVPNFEQADLATTAFIDNLSERLALETLVFSLDLLADTEALDEKITTWIDGISVMLVESISGIWTDVDLGVPSATEFGESLLALPQQLRGLISGIWTDVDLGVPSFQSLLDGAKEVATKIKGFFTNLFDDFEFPDFDFGILDKLAELGLIDLEVDIKTPETEGIGTDLAQGLVDEVEAAEESWKDAWLDFLVSPIEEGAEALGIRSPSTLTQAMAEDVIEGYAIGLSDLSPIEEALSGLDNIIILGFQNLSTEITTSTIPNIQALDGVLTILHTETLPRTTSALVEGVIPAKLELSEVNTNDLVPSVDLLIEVEEQLIETLENVVVALDGVIALKEKAKDRAKSLTKEIEKLAKAYLSLAAAIGAATSAGDGLTAPPTAPVGTPFQGGGSFIVPSNVGTEGMPIRVHANELVQIIPAQFVNKMQSVPVDVVPISIKSPQISGAPITNIISNNQQANTSSTKEFHLHVSEAPTSDVRDSFDLMETLS